MPEPSQPQPKRIDPPSRPVDGDINTAAWLTNTDPERVYMLADPDDKWCGVNEQRKLGWQIEHYRKDGPRIMGETSTDGSAMQMYGQVVMSRPLSVQKEYLARSRGVADIRAKAIGQPGGIDRVRGDGGKLAQWAQSPAEYVERS